MYNLVYDIRIGEYKLKHIESIKVESSIERMTSTATIVLPGTVFNKAIDVKSKIKPGDIVNISFGYGNLQKEFEGFLKSVQMDGGSLKLDCEDDIYTFRVDMPDKQYSHITLHELLEECLAAVNDKRDEKGLSPVYLSCDYEFSYDKFTVNTATAYDVLSKVHDETRANIYIYDGILFVQPPYATLSRNQVVYSFQKNIDRDGLSLKYRTLDERKVKIVNKGKNAQGKAIAVTVGESGGDTITMQQSGITTEDNLKRIAESVYDSKRYEGYEGSFQSWLLPKCEPGYMAILRDTDDKSKEGSYYVLSVTTEFSSSGGKRKIGLGKKL